MTLAEIQSTITLFKYYKTLGDKTFIQLTDEQLFFQPNGESNSVGIIVHHLWGNMMSRWTNFLNEDGEKEWRNRDSEFETSIQNRQELLEKWEAGWNCLFDSLNNVKENNLNDIIYIRNEGHSIFEAIQRQVAHYAYHVGQIVFLGKWLQKNDWDSLSIPKGGSTAYNDNKFSEEKRKEHFTKEFISKKS